MNTVSFEVVDVFTATRFGGNPLAVITDGRGLDTALMQQIAREFGFSETTFVLPPTNPGHTARVRIFTPTTEVPFAGHPNVGTAYVLARLGDLFGKALSDDLLFEEEAGLVAVAIQRSGTAVTGAAITAPRALEVGLEVAPAVVAACVSLSPDDIALAAHPPRFLSVGLPFIAAELVDREALSRARPNIEHFLEADARLSDRSGFNVATFLYVPDADNPAQLSARMFAPLDDVAEDPATGSASAALAAFLASRMPQSDGEIALTIVQGVDMGRPSTIRLLVIKSAGAVQRVVVSGDCVSVMRGEMSV
ncbi:MAG: PhzF family phenazine biosynthesis protein [Oscillochloris sp.]|nr:PhzF family phenazine biosynthesis protein [Oscillochloris sp.]